MLAGGGDDCAPTDDTVTEREIMTAKRIRQVEKPLTTRYRLAPSDLAGTGEGCDCWTETHQKWQYADSSEDSRLRGQA